MSCTTARSSCFGLEYAVRTALLAILTVLTAGVIESHPTSAHVGGSVPSGVGSCYWRIASGGSFKPARTAARMTTEVRLTHASTGRSVVLTINDRPHAAGRVIDLSLATATATHRGNPVCPRSSLSSGR
jgi:hypothetical protein